jgi:soluble lytic murein transglycosylase-like protein
MRVRKKASKKPARSGMSNFAKLLTVTVIVAELSTFVGVVSRRLFPDDAVVTQHETPRPEATVEEVEVEVEWDVTAGCKKSPPENLNQYLLRAGEEFGVDPRILAVTVHRESGCDRWALGSSGEIGLTQVLPSVWSGKLREAGILKKSQELWDPETNIRASAWIFSRLHEEAGGSVYGMFRRYNGSGSTAAEYAREQRQAYLRLSKIVAKKGVRVSQVNYIL